jgi:lipopolysaccharide export system protein LptC
MSGADTHSRVVGWLKVALPLAALAILSTLFLLSDRIDPQDAIPYAQVDVEDLARDPRMTAPTYAGTTRDGTALTLTAETARPVGQDASAQAATVLARMEMPDGSTAELSAGKVDLDAPAGRLLLSGGVAVTTSSGYLVLTDQVTAALDRTSAESSGPVTAETPAAHLTADRFSLTRTDADGEAYLLVFTGRVKLVYQPGG